MTDWIEFLTDREIDTSLQIDEVSISWGGEDYPQDSKVMLNGRKIGTVISQNSEKQFYLLSKRQKQFWGLSISLDGLNQEELTLIAKELIRLTQRSASWQMAYESASRAAFSIDQNQSESLKKHVARNGRWQFTLTNAGS